MRLVVFFLSVLPSVLFCMFEGSEIEMQGVIEAKALVTQFDAIEKNEMPLNECRQFLEGFIRDLQGKYGLMVTLEEGCKIVRERIHTLGISTDLQKEILTIIEVITPNSFLISLPANMLPNDSLEFQSTSETSSFQHLPSAMADPALLRYKKHKKEKHKKHIKNKHFSEPIATYTPTSLLQIAAAQTAEDELPAGMYTGGAELLAGALLLILTPVFPAAGAVGGILVGDGIRRIYDGMEQMDDKRSLFYSDSPPSSPSGVRGGVDF